ncbi:hypothetical protein FM119_06040 [Mycetocola reblochoni REB411]|uniref:Uncharacterized protein n=1 Tax=Mycetocola reblochoni REB411 TaxID=1255698 RepID=A0A1R4J9J2_9MICO|nr:hypothetical protein FM119_06040 [Mycetocola reblochoni REB411]
MSSSSGDVWRGRRLRRYHRCPTPRCAASPAPASGRWRLECPRP